MKEYKDISFTDYHNKLSKSRLDVIDISEVSKEELATRHEAAVGITLHEDWEK